MTIAFACRPVVAESHRPEILAEASSGLLNTPHRGGIILKNFKWAMAFVVGLNY